jgi:MFS transporter, PPP family, 3-phenylpropionic acid transporter
MTLPLSRRPQGELRANLLYALLQAFYWCAFCAYFSFLVAYLLENGYAKPLIGLILTMLAALTVVVPIVTGYLVDFHFPIRKFVVVVMGLAIPAAYLLRFSIASVPLAVLSIACLGMLERSQNSVLDSWAVKLNGLGVDLRYGPARAFASLSYAVTALLLGGLFARVGLDKLFIVHAVFAAGCVLSALFLQDVPVMPKGHVDRLSPREALGLLAKNPRYRLLVVCITLTGIGTVTTVAYLPMLIELLHGTSADLGVCLFVTVLCEGPLMVLYRRFSSRFAADRLLAVALFCQTLRILAPFVVPSIPWLLATQAILSLSYGLYLPSLLKYLGQITDSRMQATAITFAIASGEGVAGIVGNAAGTAVIALLGLRWVYAVVGSIAALGFLFFVVGQSSIARREADPVVSSPSS